MRMDGDGTRVRLGAREDLDMVVVGGRFSWALLNRAFISPWLPVGFQPTKNERILPPSALLCAETNIEMRGRLPFTFEDRTAGLCDTDFDDRRLFHVRRGSWASSSDTLYHDYHGIFEMHFPASCHQGKVPLTQNRLSDSSLCSPVSSWRRLGMRRII
jgi:hypothetical protein